MYSTVIRRCIVLVFVWAMLPFARAQVELRVEYKRHFVRVDRVYENRPYVIGPKGKPVGASGTQYRLVPVAEYAPEFVSIKNLGVVMHAVELEDTGGEINHEMEFRASFESAYHLENVYVALNMYSREGGRLIFVQQVENLDPGEPQDVDIRIPLNSSIGRPQYQVHIFAHGGAEVLQSMLPPLYVKIQYERMVARRIKRLTQAAPQILTEPIPEYPSKLRRKKVSGRVVIHCFVSASGEVVHPTVKSATNPAFAKAALAALGEAWFLPRVEDGVPVSTQLDLPYNFGPSPNGPGR
ncbi:MAG TPA: TonB family protein [Opitutaceae bacterium]|nr:TonB family protein [Opitutaceae bacterium]